MKSKEEKRITGLLIIATLSMVFALSCGFAAGVSAAENTAKQPLTEGQKMKEIRGYF